MRVILIKNDAWDFVSGSCMKPDIVAGNAESVKAAKQWADNDLKAQSDIILAISPSEIKQVKACETSREIWAKLQSVYQSKGPIRKVALLNQLIFHKLRDSDDAKVNTQEFLNTVDKLGEMDIQINNDLLTVMMLRSLPENFENFRCAISSRDDLPSLETLRIKILEEFDARKENRDVANQNAMIAGKPRYKRNYKKEKFAKAECSERHSKVNCFKCKKFGHFARDCNGAKKTGEEFANRAGNVSLCAVNVFKINEIPDNDKWCIDSGCTSHMCRDRSAFAEIDLKGRGKLNLASNAITEFKAKGVANLMTNVNGCEKIVEFRDALYVPDLRTNLISVGRITHKGHTVIFDKTSAKVIDNKGG